eukprot:ctg_110.g44
MIKRVNSCRVGLDGDGTTRDVCEEARRQPRTPVRSPKRRQRSGAGGIARGGAQGEAGAERAVPLETCHDKITVAIGDGPVVPAVSSASTCLSTTRLPGHPRRPRNACAATDAVSQLTWGNPQDDDCSASDGAAARGWRGDEVACFGGSPLREQPQVPRRLTRTDRRSGGEIVVRSGGQHALSARVRLLPGENPVDTVRAPRPVRVLCGHQPTDPRQPAVGHTVTEPRGLVARSVAPDRAPGGPALATRAGDAVVAAGQRVPVRVAQVDEHATQLLIKCIKSVPLLLIGRVAYGKPSDRIEYAAAAGMLLGCALFVATGPVHSARWAQHTTDATDTRGAAVPRVRPAAVDDEHALAEQCTGVPVAGRRETAGDSGRGHRAGRRAVLLAASAHAAGRVVAVALRTGGPDVHFTDVTRVWRALPHRHDRDAAVCIAADQQRRLPAPDVAVAVGGRGAGVRQRAAAECGASTTKRGDGGART